MKLLKEIGDSELDWLTDAFGRECEKGNRMVFEIV